MKETKPIQATPEEYARELQRFAKGRDAYVICCNDSVEAVCFDTAEGCRDKLSRKDYEVNKHNYTDYADYRNTLRWSVHTVRVI